MFISEQYIDSRYSRELNDWFFCAMLAEEQRLLRLGKHFEGHWHLTYCML